MTKRAVFFPGGGLDDGCARTRFYYYLPELRSRGVRCHIASYTHHRYDLLTEVQRHSFWPRLWLELLPLRSVMAVIFCQAIWMQKMTIRHWAIHLARILGKRIIYDLDDALYLNPPEGKGRSGHAIQRHDRRQQIISNAMRRADTVVVSGDTLAEFARQFARHVEILPTSVGRVAATPSVAPDPPVIVWVGAPENLRYVLGIEDVLIQLQAENPDVKIRLITSRLQDQPRFRFEFIPWSRQAEEDFIPPSTVGIAPLADDEWCRSKMNYKALVYLSHGVPAVVTPGGFPLHTFEDGSSILVARCLEDWYRELKEVIENQERRNRVASAGITTLRKTFTAAANAEKFIAILLGMNSGRHQTDKLANPAMTTAK